MKIELTITKLSKIAFAHKFNRAAVIFPVTNCLMTGYIRILITLPNRIITQKYIYK